MKKKTIILIGLVLILVAMLFSCNSAKAPKISFDSQGGSKCKTITVDKDASSIDLPIPTRDQYSFEGWYDESFSQKIDNPLPSSSFPTEDVTYYAKWEEIYYTIFFVVNGRTVATKNFSYNAQLSERDYPALTDYPDYHWEYETFRVTENRNVVAVYEKTGGEDKPTEYSVEYVVSDRRYAYYTGVPGTAIEEPDDPIATGGNYFVGWSLYNGGEPVSVLPSTITTTDLTYYALFRAVPDSTDYLVYREVTDARGSVGIVITGLTAEGSYQQEIGIPSQIGGKNVVAVGYEDKGTKKISELRVFDSSALTTVYLPSTLVTVGDWAFSDCTSLQKVVFRGKNLFYIGYGAFAGCSSLISFSLTEQVTMVEDYAFSGLTLNKTEKKLPEEIRSGMPAIWQSENWYVVDMTLREFSLASDSVLSSIGSYGFYHCKNLTGITLSSSMLEINYLSFVESGLTEIRFHSGGSLNAVGGAVYSSNGKILYYYPVCGQGVFTVPDGVTTISKNAFRGNVRLTSVTFSDSVVTIESNCFRDCALLAGVTFGANSALTTVAEGAFADCGALLAVNFPARLKNFAERVFENDISLNEVTFAGTDVVGIGAYAFYRCVSLDQISLPGKIGYIGEYAFYDCSSMVVFRLTGNEIALTSIGDYAFCDCSELAVVYLPETLKFIGDYAFYGQSKKMKMELENNNLDSLECLGIRAFANTSVKEFTLRSKLIRASDALAAYGKNYTIGEYAFADCTSLKSFSFSQTDTYSAVPEGLLYGCTALTDITFKYNIKTIGDYALYGCTALKKVTFDKQNELDRQMIEEIGAYSFAGCRNLLNGEGKSRLLPTSLKRLGEGAFRDCTAIHSVTIPENLEVISKDAFYGCATLSIVSYEAPETNKLHTLGENCFGQCTMLGREYTFALPVSLGLRTAGKGFIKNPFFGCTSLKAFSFPNGNNNGLFVQDGIVYNGSTSDIYAFPTAKIGDAWDVPGSVSVIEDYAFYGATISKLGFIANESVDNKVTMVMASIGNYAFAESSLASVTLTARVNNVGAHAFENCNIVSLEIERSFYRDGDRIDNKEYETAPAADNTIVIGDYAFFHTALISVVFPHRLTEVGDGAFASCYDLATLDFTDAVAGLDNTIALGDSVFAGDSSVRNVVLPGRLSRLGKYAFNNCYNLESVTFTESDVGLSIDDYAFSNNHFLYEVTLPSNILSLGKGIFADDTRLKYVYFPDVLTLETTLIIPEDAFLGDDMLDSLTVPAYVTEIGRKAYYGTHLYEIFFKEGLYPLSIGEYAFADATNLTSVVLPNNCVFIGEYAFSGVKNLKEIVYSGTHYHKTLVDGYTAGDAMGDRVVYEKSFYPATGTYRPMEKYYTLTRFVEFTLGANIDRPLYADDGTGVYIPVSGSYQQEIRYFIADEKTGITVGDPCDNAFVIRYGKSPSLEFKNGVEYYQFAEAELSGSDEEIFYVKHDDKYVTDFGIEIGRGAFIGTSLTEFTVDGRVCTLGEKALSGIPTLTTAIVDGRFDTLPSEAFFGDDALTQVFIGEKIDKIADRAFYMSGVETVSSLNGTAYLNVNGIGEYAFYRSALRSLFVHTTAETTIKNNAFEKCSELTSVTIETTGRLIAEEFVFGDCQKLSVLSLTADSMTLGKGFAYNAVSLESGFSVTETGTPTYFTTDGVLYTYTSSGVEIVFYPAGKTGSFLELTAEIRSIGDYAFYGNEYLTGILIRYTGGTVLALGEESLTETDNIIFYVASNLVSLYKNEWATSSVQAFSTNLGGFVLTVQNTGKYYVSSYLGDEADLTVRGSMTSGNTTYEITGIAKDAFRNNINLRSVRLDAGIKTVSNSAFRGCTSLESVYVGANVTAIKNYAFYGCTKLTQLTFAPDSSVVSIGNYAFAECAALRSVTLPARLENIGSYAFSNAVLLENVVFSEKLTEIKNNAFENCDSLSSVVLPASVTSLGKYLFRNCDNLIYIRCLSENVPLIDENTFTGVPAGIFFFVPGKSVNRYNVDSRWRNHIDKLLSADYIYDPEGATTFSAYVLEPIESGTYRLIAYISDEKVVTLDAHVAQDVTVTAIGENAFAAFVEEIDIGEGVTTIDANAFTYATSLRRVHMSYTVEKIGSYSFANLNNLTTVLIDDPQYVLANKEAKAYYDKDVWRDNYDKFLVLEEGEYRPASFTYSASARYYFVKGLFTIGDHAFYNDVVLSSIGIPESTTVVGKYAFSCDEDKGMTLGEVVFDHSDIPGTKKKSVRVEEYAFANNSSLMSVTFNCYLAYLGEGAFRNCKTMTSLYLNYKPARTADYKVTEVPYGAQKLFENCDKLSIIVPALDQLNKYKNDWGASENKYNVKTYILNKFVCASPFVIGDFVYAYFSHQEKKLTVLGYIGNETEITFRGSVTMEDGLLYSVVRIGRENLAEEGEVNGSVIPNTVTSVTIPGSVTTIDVDAFRNSLGLRTVQVNDKGLTEIKAYAFAYCPNLVTVNLPTSLRTIGERAFAGCDSLNGYDASASTGIYIEDSRTLKDELVIETGAFENCRSMTSFRMPAQLKTIGSYVFSGCTSLEAVRYGDSYYLDSGEVLGEQDVNLETVGSYAFAHTAISEIILPETATWVYDHAFMECQNLLAVYLFREIGSAHSDITRADRTIFDGIKTNNTKIYVPASSLNNYKGKEGWNQKQIVSRRFYGDFAYEINGESDSGVVTGRESVTLTAYRGTEKELTIPDAIVLNGSTYFVTAIEAYFGTPNLEKVLFTNTSHVYKIGSYAFAGCTALREIILPCSDPNSTLAMDWTEVEIGDHAFNNCSALTDVHLPLTITYLAAYIFNGCTSLEELTIPSEIGNTVGKEGTIAEYGGILGNAAFYNCVSLARLRFKFTFPQNTTSTKRGSDVFYYAGSQVEGGLKIIVPAAYLSNFAEWEPRVGDFFSFAADTLLFGDYLMQNAVDGYSLLQYRGDANVIDLDGDFSGKRIVSIADDFFLSEHLVSCGDLVLRTNTADGNWTLVSYDGAEDLDLTGLLVLGRRISRIDSLVTVANGGIMIKVNGEVSYDDSLTAVINISEE